MNMMNEDCRFEDGTITMTVKVSSANGHDDVRKREREYFFKKNFLKKSISGLGSDEVY
jgi:hypothetical protein